jgi:hypothetical protein
VQRFRGGLVFKAHRLLYHSTLDLREIKKKEKFNSPSPEGLPSPATFHLSEALASDRLEAHFLRVVP